MDFIQLFPKGIRAIRKQFWIISQATTISPLYYELWTSGLFIFRLNYQLIIISQASNNPFHEGKPSNGIFLIENTKKFINTKQIKVNFCLVQALYLPYEVQSLWGWEILEYRNFHLLFCCNPFKMYSCEPDLIILRVAVWKWNGDKIKYKEKKQQCW